MQRLAVYEDDEEKFKKKNMDYCFFFTIYCLLFTVHCLLLIDIFIKKLPTPDIEYLSSLLHLYFLPGLEGTFPRCRAHIEGVRTGFLESPVI